MNIEEFYNELESEIDIENGTINNDLKIRELPAWDSMANISFLALCEEKFGVVIDYKQIKQAETFGDLASLLGDHISK